MAVSGSGAITTGALNFSAGVQVAAVVSNAVMSGVGAVLQSAGNYHSMVVKEATYYKIPTLR